MPRNIFSQAGLFARGMDEGAMNAARIADAERTNRFNEQNDPLRLREAQQGLELGRMRNVSTQAVLDEETRLRAEQAASRAAVAGAGSDRLSAAGAAAEAARAAGNLKAYNELSASIPTLQREGFGQLVQDALIGTPPAQAVQNFNRMGAGRLSAAEWGKDPATGDILMHLTDAPTGERRIINATKMRDILSPQKSDVHAVPAGGMGIVTTPGRTPQTFAAPVKDEFDIKDGILFNKGKGTWMQVDTQGDWHLGTITHGNMEIPVRVNRKNGTVEQLGPGGQRTGLPQAHVTFSPTGGAPIITIGDKTFEFKPATEATPPRSGWLSDTPGTAGSLARLEPIKMPQTPPRPDAKIGKDPEGKEHWYVPDPNKPGGWAIFPTAGETAAPGTQTTARPAPAPGPVAAPRAVVPPAPVASQADALKAEVGEPAIPAEFFDAQGNYIGAPRGAGESLVVQGGRAIGRAATLLAEQEKQKRAAFLKSKMLKGNVLTPNEITEAQQLKLIPPPRNFNLGGMVTRYQRNGLG